MARKFKTPKPVAHIQVLTTGNALERRKRADGTLEYLVVWSGDSGEEHRVWITEDQIKILKGA